MSERNNCVENSHVEQVNGAEQKWEDLRENAERLGVEPGIEELFIGLNLLGYRTMFSCEGHPPFERFFKDDSKIFARWRPAYIVFNFKTDSDKVNQVETLIDEFYQDRMEKPGTKLCVSNYTKGYALLSTQNINQMELSQDKKGLVHSISASCLLSQQQELSDFGHFLKAKYFNSAH